MSLAPLRATLIARAAVSVAFAVYLVETRPASNPELARAFVPFAAVDGILAFALAVLVMRAHWPPGIALVAVVDGLVRCAGAAFLWFGPGAPYFSVTIVLYVAALATLSFALGVIELGEARRLRRTAGFNPISGALALAGLATIVLAVVAFIALPQPESTRRLLVIAAAFEAVALLTVAWGARAPRHRVVGFGAPT